jgi:hypothetical protein
MDDLSQLKVPEQQRPDDLDDDVRLRWVPGYEGDYGITDDGRVYSWARNWPTKSGARKMSTREHPNGYRTITFRGNGDKSHCLVHRVVLFAFHGPPPEEGYECRHLDGSRDNNSADNLTWGTRQENINDKRRHGTLRKGHEGLKGEDHGRAKLTEEEVKEIRQRYDSGSVLQKELADEFGVARGYISDIVNRETWTHV